MVDDIYQYCRAKHRYWEFRKLNDNIFVIYLIGDKPYIVFYDLANHKIIENINYFPYSFDGWCKFIDNDVFGNYDNKYTVSNDEENDLLHHYDDYYIE